MAKFFDLIFFVSFYVSEFKKEFLYYQLESGLELESLNVMPEGACRDTHIRHIQ